MGHDMADSVENGYHLVVQDHVPYVDPSDYGITDFDGINPSDYFITSGDACWKAEQLKKDLWAAAGQTRKKYGKSSKKRHRAFNDEMWKAAGKASSLLHTLNKVKGDAIFLETEWRNHNLYCIPKNPRRKE